MSLDVSIYSSRTETGYFSTVAGGSARPIGIQAYSAATGGTGGSQGGVVYTTKSQRISDLKIFDSSTYFTYDISVGGMFIIKGTNFDVSIGGISSAQDGSALVYNDGHWTYGVGGDSGDFIDEASLGGDFYWGDGSLGVNTPVINELDDIGDVNVPTPGIDQALIWNGTYWIAQDVSGTSPSSLDTIGNVNTSGKTLGQALIWGGTSWNAQDVSALGVTFSYVDGSLAQRDSSISDLFAYNVIQDVSIALGVTYLYVDGSLAFRDSSINTNASHISTNSFNISNNSDDITQNATDIGDVSTRLSTISVDTSLGGLTDVAVTDVSTEDIISYNGTNWINENTEDIDDIFQPIAEFRTVSSTTASGAQGDMAYDASYFYMCTSTNIWIRILGDTTW